MMKGQYFSFMFQYLAEVLLKILTYVAILINYKGRLKESLSRKSQGDHVGGDTQCAISDSIPHSLEWEDSCLSLSLLSFSRSSSLSPHFHPPWLLSFLSSFPTLSPSPLSPLPLPSMLSDLFPGVTLLASHCDIWDKSNGEIKLEMNLHASKPSAHRRYNIQVRKRLI